MEEDYDPEERYNPQEFWDAVNYDGDQPIEEEETSSFLQQMQTHLSEYDIRITLWHRPTYLYIINEFWDNLVEENLNIIEDFYDYAINIADTTDMFRAIEYSTALHPPLTYTRRVTNKIIIGVLHLLNMYKYKTYHMYFQIY